MARRVLTIAMAALCGACAGSAFAAPVSAESLQDEQQLQDTDQTAQRNQVADLSSWLGLVNLRDEPKYDQVTFIYYWFADAAIGVTVINNPTSFDKEGQAVQNARLYASVISLAGRDYETDGDLIHDRIVTDRYETKISDQAFYSVAEEMAKSDFYSKSESDFSDREPEQDGIIMICEGPSYFIEARVAGRQKLIARDDCSDSFPDDLHYAEALLELAKRKVPPIRKRLNEAERRLRRR